MKLHEYQSKTIFSKHGIPIPKGRVAATADEAKQIAEELGGRVVIKAQVLVGGRGKAGGVKVAKNADEAGEFAQQILAMEIKGLPVRKVLVDEAAAIENEIYFSITNDRAAKKPVMIASAAGGVDIEEVADDKKITFPIDVYQGLGAYQASDALARLGCANGQVSLLSRSLVDLWDTFISTGMRMCEVTPWRITPEGKAYACDFKAIFDEANFKFRNLGFSLPEYPVSKTIFEEELAAWNASSYRGQAHACELSGDRILPILFGGGASTIITETLLQNGGSPIILSDFGGNPPYERMLGTAKLCFDHHLAHTKLLLILGGNANNTLIDVTFKAISDALQEYVYEHGPLSIPVVVGRGGPRLVQGVLFLRDTLDSLQLPYVIFGPETPVTQVAEYAAQLVNDWQKIGDNK